MKKNITISEKKNEKSKRAIWFYLVAIVTVFIISFSYTFEKKLDMNGDNAEYYMLAQSIVQGEGYRSIGNIDLPATNVFPPGYPLLMSPVMFFTDSIFPQKILNGLFLLASIILLFLFMVKNGKSMALSFVVSVIVLLNSSLLYFASIMMSEMAFILFTMITLYLLSCIQEDKICIKDKYFYLLIIVATYATLIRSQGITLVVAVIGYFLLNKKWWHSLGALVGYFIFSRPWSIRNSLAGIENRYIQQTFLVNPWRPEEGHVTIGQFIERGLETWTMLITKAVPSVVVPYLNIDESVAAGVSDWVFGILILAIIFIGFWQFGKYKYFFYAYIVAVAGILFGWNAPSGARYITTLIPFLEMGMIVGIYAIISYGIKKMNLKVKFSPLLLLILCFFSFPSLKQQRLRAQQSFPSGMKNYILIAEQMKKEGLNDKVVGVRKPSLFYVYSKTFVSGYVYSSDRSLVVEGLLKDKVDYVVLDQLGYSSTPLYLYPAIQHNPDLFDVVLHYPNPDTYLLRFNKEKAKEKLEKGLIQ